MAPPKAKPREMIAGLAVATHRGECRAIVTGFGVGVSERSSISRPSYCEHTHGCHPFTVFKLTPFAALRQVVFLAEDVRRFHGKPVRPAIAAPDTSDGLHAVSSDTEPNSAMESRHTRRPEVSACDEARHPTLGGRGIRLATGATPRKGLFAFRSLPANGPPHARSKRSRFITLCQAATKSSTNFRLLSSQA